MNLQFTGAESRNRFHRIALSCAWVLLALSVALFFVRTFFPSLTGMTHSFPAYYMASRLVITREWDVRVYDDAWFGQRVLALTDGRVSENMANPPTTSFLLVPLAWLDLTNARIVWQTINLVLVIAALWLLARTLQVGLSIRTVIPAALVWVYPPLVENFRVGQAYVFLLFLFALALWAETNHRANLAGIALGLALSIKLGGLPIVLLFLVRRSWRPVIAAVGTAAALGTLALFYLGAESWLAFIRRTAENANAPFAAHVAYQSVPGFLQRLFVPSIQFNPTPLFNAPLLAPILSLIVSLAMVGITLWFARSAAFDASFAAGVTLSVILFPLALEYHYTLLLLPLAVLSGYLLRSHTRADILWLAFILFLLYIPMDWNASRWNEPAWTLFAYPRFYGGILLWFQLVRTMATAPQPHFRNELTPAHDLC